MVHHAFVLYRTFRRFFSRSELVIPLLGLSKHEGTAAQPGLVLIQIDGLSFKEFQRGLKHRHLPFLSRLIAREKYRAVPMYSGMPSSTPAVQAELFYGVRTSVPSFGFRDPETGRLIKMHEYDAARRIESILEKQGEPLLKEGSSYSNIFKGGAAESHFCAAHWGIWSIVKLIHPIALPILLLCYLDILVRTLVLLAAELCLAVYDCARGLVRGYHILRELQFVMTRVATSVLLREFVVMGAQVDVARGLPIIHMNLIGYDEQAHHRGPDSRFARWTLKGIDHAVARVWRAAQRSSRRDYDVWLYSDHGQEKVKPYPVARGRFLEDAVAEIFGKFDRSKARADRRSWRERGRERVMNRVLPTAHSMGESKRRSGVLVSALGPVGHLYPERQYDAQETEALARKLVTEAGIPMVLTLSGEKVLARTPRGDFLLPDQASELLGDDHPFAKEVGEDFVQLCRHPEAGRFVVCGWNAAGERLTFPLEIGSHGGPGPRETQGFSLVSPDAPRFLWTLPHLRPLDLREGALQVLGRKISLNGRISFPRKTLRIMTYNVHGCIGMDGRSSPERIARVIARHDPDAVALQELDLKRGRTGGVDQAQRIAEKLEMSFHSHPAFCFEDGEYGNAILSRVPMTLMKMGKLSGLARRGRHETRGALWVAVNVEGKMIHILNTHLSLWPRERQVQATELLGPEWLEHPDLSGPAILCGDLNALPGSESYRTLTSRLDDAQTRMHLHVPKSTWLGRYPLSRIDHVFVDRGVQVSGVHVSQSELDILASDHLPLIVEVQL